MEAKWSKWIEIGFILIFIAFGLMVALSNEFAVLNWLTIDDAYYYYKVAYNIGAGLGSSFDGVNMTNGYHPLWMLICVPVFLLAQIDLILPLRVIVMITVALSAGSAIFLFRMLRRYLKFPLALLVTTFWAFYLPIFRLINRGGLETALSAFFIIFLWERVTALNQQEQVTPRQILMVGIVAIFTFLSRLDNIFVVFFAGVWVWLRWWRPGKPVKNAWEAWRWRLRTGFAFYLPVTLTLLAYLGLNQWLFGSAMPVSSRVKLWWGTLGKTIYGGPLYIYTDYLFEYLLPASRGAGPWQFITESLHTTAIEFWKQRGRDFTFEPLVITYGVVLGSFAAVLAPGWKQVKTLVQKLGLLPLFAATMVHSWYYFLRDAYNLREWYWVSEHLFVVLVLAVALSVLLGYLNKLKFMETLRWVVSAGIVLVLVFGVLRYGTKKMYREVGDTPHTYLVQAETVRQEIASDDVIASIGSGALGYFLPEYTVVNLDGLINSIDYLEHMKNGTVIEYLKNMDVRYVLGSPYIVIEAVPYADLVGAYLEFDSEIDFSEYTWSVWQVVYPE